MRAIGKIAETKSPAEVEKIEENYLFSDNTRVVHIPLDDEIATMSDRELRQNAKALYLEEKEILSEKAVGSGRRMRRCSFVWLIHINKSSNVTDIVHS